MTSAMNPVTFVALFVAGLLAGLLALLEVGRRIALRHRARYPEDKGAGLGAIEGALFALLGLLIAFTFSGAAERFEARRKLIVEEANAIGTAYLRLDLLPAAVQPGLRDGFRRYVDSRLAVYRAIPDLAAVRKELARSALLQNEIWTASGAACGEASGPQACMLVLPALNEMIDITTTRTVAAQTHPPGLVFAMLTVLALTCALLAGYGMGAERTRSWIHIIGFAAMMTITIYVIIDYEFPRIGLIRINAVDQVLIDVRQGMN
jgi:hypothetical protein